MKGGPIADAYIRELLPRLGRKAGILGRVHAHGLRHFFAATSTRLAAPIEHLRRALGHSDLGRTQRYLARIAPEDTRDALMAAWSRLPSIDTD